MPRRTYDEDDDNKPAEPAVPVEPNGYELTRRRRQQADTLAKMQKVADEIAARLRGYVGKYITESKHGRRDDGG